MVWLKNSIVLTILCISRHQKNLLSISLFYNINYRRWEVGQSSLDVAMLSEKLIFGKVPRLEYDHLVTAKCQMNLEGMDTDKRVATPLPFVYWFCLQNMSHMLQSNENKIYRGYCAHLSLSINVCKWAGM